MFETDRWINIRRGVTRPRVALLTLIAMALLVPSSAVLAATGDITTVAGRWPAGFSGDGGQATDATLDSPFEIVLDSSGNLFIADSNNHRIRRVDGTTGVITTVAGDGTAAFAGDGGLATSASLNGPRGVAVDGAGNLFIADRGNQRVRRVDGGTGIITTFAGDGSFAFSGDGGQATDASFAQPRDLALDGSGNLFIVDFFNERIRRVDGTTGIVTTVAGDGAAAFAGDGGQAIDASLDAPVSIALDASGNLFIDDRDNNRIRRVDGTTGVITTVAGDGTAAFAGDGGLATAASLDRPTGVAVDAAGNLFVTDANNNARVRRVDGGTGIITTVAGDGNLGFSGDGGAATSARIANSKGVALDGAGNLFFADRGNHVVRRVDGATGIITTFAGGGFLFAGDGGLATAANLNSPRGVAVDGAGNLFIVDPDSNRIRRVDATTGVITTVAGNGSPNFSGDDGPATSAGMSPVAVEVDGSGNLFIADARDNERVRRVDATTGIITTVAGNGTTGFSGDDGPATSASLNRPRGIAVDRSGNVFIADRFNHRVRRVDGTTGIITTVAGNGTAGFGGDDGPATSASLKGPLALTVDGSGNLFIPEFGNNRIRRVDGATGVITTVAGDGTAGFSGDDGFAILASINHPRGTAVDTDGNLFIADGDNARIRRVDATTGIITTVAGTGTEGFAGDEGAATDALISRPRDVAIDSAGNLIIADRGNYRIRQVEAAAVPAQAGTGAISVINTNDSGPGSLRLAILEANARAGVDTIVFDIPAAFDPGCNAGTFVCTIQPTSSLPAITDPVVIDGYTQPGASPNTNGPGLGLNTVLRVELDGTNAGALPAGLNIIAGGSTVRGLVISRFDGNGIQIHGIGATGNLVHGNFIGTDVTGTADLGNSGDGVFIAGGARLNVIGGAGSSAGNVISGNGGNGVHIAGGALDTRDNTVQGNLIGTDVTGTTPIGNAIDGVILGTVSDNLIGGLAPGARNIIVGNDRNGVNICCGGSGNRIVGNVISANGLVNADGGGVNIGGAAGPSGNFVQGNLIGTDITGSSAWGNGQVGVRIFGGPTNNTIGGTEPGEGNVISGNLGTGMFIGGTGTTGNMVLGNLIGTDITGTQRLGNGQFGGIDINNAPGNHIGGAADGAGNVISDNPGRGLMIHGSGAVGNMVQGNFIGTNLGGTVALGNNGNGVSLFDGASNTTIGGSGPGAGNVISGNTGNGVRIADPGTTGNVVSGNLIGTDVTGAFDLGNDRHGVRLVAGASANIIGGTSAAERNIISGNAADGVVIVDPATTGNVVLGNFIGTDVAGTASLANSGNGVLIAGGASGNLIGGAEDAAQNLISGNSGNGVAIFGPGTTGNAVQGNFIGTDVTGTASLGNSAPGIGIGDSAANNVIGGTEAGAGNLISGNMSTGIAIGTDVDPGATGNLVQGNFIGTDVTGSFALGNSNNGVNICCGATHNTIGGTGPGALNIISANGNNGVKIRDSGTEHNVVSGNYIGTDVTGTVARANAGAGVAIDDGARANTVGGTTAGERNIISGNDEDGVQIRAGTKLNVVSGNYIGTDVTGTVALGNNVGVRIQDASDNTIGGLTAGARNLISGNRAHGIRMAGGGATSNVVQGNFIGTDVTGTMNLGNAGHGLNFRRGASNNTVGGAVAAARNIISGNEGNGIHVRNAGTTGNVVQGNFIGTDADGTADLRNTASGVQIRGGASDNLIGGSVAGERNIISANGDSGVLITGPGTNDNRVSGNYIGTDVTGGADLGNGFSGVAIEDGAQLNTVGGTSAGEGNIISGNDGPGVRIGTRVYVLGDFVVEDNKFELRMGERDYWGYGAFDRIASSPFPPAIVMGPIEVGDTVSFGRCRQSGSRSSKPHHMTIALLGFDRNLDDGRFGSDPPGGPIGNVNDPTDNCEFTFFAPGDYIIDDSTDPGEHGAAKIIVEADDIPGARTYVLREFVVEDGRFELRMSETPFWGYGAFQRIESSTVLPEIVMGPIQIGGTISFDRCRQSTARSTKPHHMTIEALGIDHNLDGKFGTGGATVGVGGDPTNNCEFTFAEPGEYVIDDSTDPGEHGVAKIIVDANFVSPSGNAILGNSIFSNDDLGIDLNGDGVTPNDSGDGDTGANNLQNFPGLTFARPAGGGITIHGDLNSTPNMTFRLEFFSNSVCDPSDHGEGETFLGFTDVTSDGSGNSNFTVTFPTAVPAGQFITSTATDPNNNTSEFSRCKLVTNIDIDIKPGNDPNSINCLNEREVITVAILTMLDFDATTVDHTTVEFEGASEAHVDGQSGDPRRHEEDVDGDGDTDLVFHFQLGATGLTCASTEGTLTGETFGGQAVAGLDAVRMVAG